MPTTLRLARRRLGSVTGIFFVSTTTGIASAADYLVLGDLADVDADTAKLSRYYAMPTSTTTSNTGVVRRIRKDGFTAATGNTRVVAAYSSATSSGIEVEIYGPLPPKDADGRIGLHTAINRALAECWSIDMLSITPSTSGQSTYSLSTVAEWIISDQQIVDLWFRRSGSTADELMPEWRYQADVDSGQLEIRGVSLSTTDTLKPKVYRPLDRWIEVNSTWANSTSGLVNDSDRCLLSEDGIEAVGRAHVYKALALIGDVDGRQMDRNDANLARQDANRWKHANLPREFGRPVHWYRARSLTAAGPWPREGSLG